MPAEKGGRRLLWEENTFPAVEHVLAAGAVALLPVGAIEPHGPHLPLGTDVIIAAEMARRAAVELDRRKVRCFLLPPIVYSVAEWSASFPGVLSLRPSTVRAVVREVCLGAHSAGSRQVALANAHLEPGHVACLREACREVAAETGWPPVFPDITRRSLAQRLGEAFLSGDHAGRFETALVMAARPELVDEAVRRTLPPVNVSLVEKIRAGAGSFRQVGMDRAYCGDPAAASAAEGETLFDELAGILVEGILAALAGEEGESR